MALLKIPLSETWQQIVLASNYKNNINERILVEQSVAAPTGDDGLVITRYEKFRIPSDGNNYWARTFHGTGEIVQDPTASSSGGPGGTTFEVSSANETFAGGSNYTEVTLSADPGVAFQIIVIPVGDETVVADVGGITVTYTASDTFRVYNSGLGGTEFSWIAMTN